MIAPNSLQDKTAVITGGTSGLGKAIGLKLAQAGATLILVGRNSEKGQAAVAELQAAASNRRIHYWQYDLSLMRVVDEMARKLQAELPQLDILIQSAGVMLPRRTLTAEGLETVFAVQYLARFYLTQRLLDRLSANARIVSISAAGTMPIQLDFGNLNGEKFYHGVLALMHESVANDLFSMRLWRLHPDLRFYNYGPFYVKTGLFVHMPWWFTLATETVGRLVATTPEVAAADVTRLITEDRPVGMYSRRLRMIRPNRYRADPAVQDRLWETSQKLVAMALNAHVPQMA